MRARAIIGCLFLLVFFQHAWSEDKTTPIAEGEVGAAASKAIKLVQQSQKVWSQRETCTSCHHQLLTEIPIALARARSVPFDQTVARDTTASSFAYFKDLDGAVQGYDYIDVYFDGWALVAAHAAGVKPNLTTDAYAQFIASRQLPDGSWYSIDMRPPQSHSAFSATAICAQAVQNYMPEQLKGERDTRVLRARAWLLTAQPQTTEDRAFQLLGLRWTGADEDARKSATRQLLGQQREDGGWSQLASMVSDAYATGQVLYALQQGGGLSTSDAAYQRGLRFLLKLQEPDGSWRVRTRLNPPAPLSPPYFETGFPYKKDQFISIMGTSWATAAALLALPEKSSEKSHGVAIPNLDPTQEADWMRVALNGSAANLKKVLDGGTNPNSKTAAGTTALMLAARDLQKVKLLVERGADVNARAATGFTALMVASRYSGNSEVVQFLLKNGAQASTPKGVEVRNDASALFFAVTAGDVKSATALVNAGANPNERMKLLGRIPVTAPNYATVGGDVAMVDYLITKGADANELDGDGISLLGWAALGNRVSTVKLLLKRGAKINPVDKFGMTPLLYAASVDFGDTAVIETLIAAGADVKAKSKQGLTPFDLAKNYNYASMAKVLADRRGMQ